MLTRQPLSYLLFSQMCASDLLNDPSFMQKSYVRGDSLRVLDGKSNATAIEAL